jgi:hypothetical protein
MPYGLMTLRFKPQVLRASSVESRFAVLLIITFRPEFAATRYVGRSEPPAATPTCIKHVVSGKALPKEITEQIIERTDGIPLDIEELTKAAVESGMLSQSGERYTATRSTIRLAIPTSLRVFAPGPT